MAKKPFPFSVCEQCCSTGGGGGEIDVTGIEAVVVEGLSGVTAKQLIESSKAGSIFDIRGTLSLWNEGITFPERSTIISSTRDGVIYNPYDGSINYVDVIISNNSTVKGVTFKSSATVSTPASTFKIMNNCTFDSCAFIGELADASIYETGVNNTFIGCDLGELDLKFSDTELTNTYINCTGIVYVETDSDKPEELEKLKYIKAMNPETSIMAWFDDTTIEIEPLYSLNTGKESNAPDYIIAEAERVAKAVQDTRTAKSLVFPVLSDFHLYADSVVDTHKNSLISAQYAKMGIEEMRKRMDIDFVGYLGDFTWGANSFTVEQVKKDLTLAKETSAFDNTELWCVGNHDINYGANRDRLMTNDELYAYIGANSDGVKPYVNIERCYGYMDFDNQKLRVIYLNTCDASDWDTTEGVDARSEWISPTQLQWVADTALNFTDKKTPSEWGVVIISHHPLHYANSSFDYIMKLLEAYKDGLSGAISCTVKTEVVDGETKYIQQKVTYDFSTTERAEIICNIHGHNHNCGYSQISSTSRADSETVKPWLWRISIPQICADRYNTGKDVNAKYGEYDENGNPVFWYKETGTAKATSFCMINIDRTNELIHAFIFGAGKDRTVSYHKAKYTNQIPISTDADGNIYDGDGWKADTRLSSSGTDTSGTGYGVTGFIPCGHGSSQRASGEQVIYLANIEALPTDSNVRIAYYDAEKTKIGLASATTWVESFQNSKVIRTLDENGYVKTIDISPVTGYLYEEGQTTAYIRFCAKGLDGDSIITLNEPIE